MESGEGGEGYWRQQFGRGDGDAARGPGAALEGMPGSSRSPWRPWSRPSPRPAWRGALPRGRLLD
eukprot:4407990-Pyramimonas_sp.AAC.1